MIYRALSLGLVAGVLLPHCGGEGWLEQQGLITPHDPRDLLAIGHGSVEQVDTGTTRYSGPLRFKGTRPPAEVDATAIRAKGVSVHPVTRRAGSSFSQVLASADSGELYRNIYAPVLYYDAVQEPHIIYGGWESSSWPPTDRIYQMDAEPDDLGPNTLTTDHNGHMILQPDPSDPTMYHINDPSFIDLGDCHYRIYFEVETLNVDVRTGAHVDPADFVPASSTHRGFTAMSVGYADSFDCGASWNGGRPITRANLVDVTDLTGNDYFNYQFGWPVVVASGDEIHMYFVAGSCPSRGSYRFSTFNEVVSQTGDGICLEGGEIDGTFRFGHRRQLHAVSDDGLTFTLDGELRLANGALVWGLDDIKPIAGSAAWLATGPGATVKETISEPGELAASWNYNADPWGKYIGYIDPDDPVTLRFTSPLAASDSSIDAIVCRPSPMDDGREPISVRIARDAGGSFRGFLYGEWEDGTASNSYLAGALFQRNIQIVGQVGGVGPMLTIEFNTAIDDDETLVSLAHNLPGASWSTHRGTAEYDPVWGRARLIEYDGSPICESDEMWFYPGQTYTYTCEATVPDPPARRVVVVSPPDQATGVSLNPGLTWTHGGDATDFWIDVSTRSDFAWFWNRNVGGSTRQLTYDGSGWHTNGAAPGGAPGALAHGTTYYVRIVPFNHGTALSGQVGAASFTTVEPSKVTIASPAAGAVGVSVNPSLAWTYSGDATDFWIDISERADFAWFWNRNVGASGRELTYDGSRWGRSGSAPSAAPSTLEYDTTYYVRIVPFRNGTLLAGQDGRSSFTTDQ